MPHELLAGFVAAVEYFESLGFDAIVAWERELGERFLAGPAGERAAVRPADDGGPRPDVRVQPRGPLARRRSRRSSAAADIAVWWGDYYAVETMKRLGLEEGGAVRAGILHYNTPDEVDRLLEALASF